MIGPFTFYHYCSWKQHWVMERSWKCQKTRWLAHYEFVRGEVLNKYHLQPRVFPAAFLLFLRIWKMPTYTANEDVWIKLCFLSNVQKIKPWYLSLQGPAEEFPDIAPDRPAESELRQQLLADIIQEGNILFRRFRQATTYKGKNRTST